MKRLLAIMLLIATPAAVAALALVAGAITEAEFLALFAEAGQ